MNITHRAGKLEITQKSSLHELNERHAQLFTLSPSGNYLALPLASSFVTNYQGWHVLSCLRKNQYVPYKIIENITLQGTEEASIPLREVKNTFATQERCYADGITETLMLTRNALVYTLEGYIGEVLFTLDFRSVIEHPQFGRIYSITQEKDCVVVEYVQYTDESLSLVDHRMYLVICGAPAFTLVNKWVKREYTYDASRGVPAAFYVYEACSITISNARKKTILTCSAGPDKKQALAHAREAYATISEIKKSAQEYVSSIIVPRSSLELSRVPIKRMNKIAMGYACATHTLSHLLMDVSSSGMVQTIGLWAGLPWFFQQWSRDELISLYGLMLEGHYHASKNILWNHLKHLRTDGRLNNIASGANLDNTLASADSVGWLFKRIKDFMNLLELKDEFNKFFTFNELIYVKGILEYSITALQERFVRDGLVINNALETWMDTFFDDTAGIVGGGAHDHRVGARIEIQTLFLGMLRLINMLNELLSNKLVKKKGRLVNAEHLTQFVELEEQMRARVRETFLFKQDGKYMLRDGVVGEFGDVLRPNIFIAYYLYPELLSSFEWEEVFDAALEKLWCDWNIGGGLSTIAKDHPLYHAQYTGQNNRSYHRGDSWFYVNHIAAIALYRLNKKKYNPFIQKIIDASCEDTLFSGYIGAGSELSSSGTYKPGGCFAQTWSMATFIELVHEMFLE